MGRSQLILMAVCKVVLFLKVETDVMNILFPPLGSVELVFLETTGS